MTKKHHLRNKPHYSEDEEYYHQNQQQFNTNQQNICKTSQISNAAESLQMTMNSYLNTQLKVN